MQETHYHHTYVSSGGDGKCNSSTGVAENI